MANAVPVNIPKTAIARQYNVGSNNSISGGALLALTDPRTASGAYTTRVAFAGVAAAEKDPLDGSTKLGIYEPGSHTIWDVEASGAIPIGGLVMLSGANKVSWMAADPLSGAAAGFWYNGYQVGRALETAANAEIFEVII